MKLGVDVRWTFLSLRTLILENQILRVVILPEVGGRIWSIVYKPLDREVLWHNPRVPPRRQPFGASYDDVWCGGWDDLFPNDAPAVIGGISYPDHGEAWSIPWDWSTEVSDETVGVHLQCETPISGARLEKRITLSAGLPQLQYDIGVTNTSADDLEFLWKLHPAFAISTDCRIDFPDMQVETDPEYPASLEQGMAPSRWPSARSEGHEVDLSRVLPPSSRKVYFLYGTGYRQGWCAVTDTKARVSFGLLFPREVFRSCWLFATYGGWRNYNVAVLEPSTTYPYRLEQAIERGSTARLAPGKTLKARVIFQAQEGLSRVAQITPDGRFLE